MLAPIPVPDEPASAAPVELAAEVDTTEQYWASKSGVDLAEECYDRVKAYYQDLPQLVMYQRWSKAYRAYYGLSTPGNPFDVSRAVTVGEQNQLTSLRLNHAGSLGRRAVTLVSQAIPEWEPVPTNNDYTSLAQAAEARKLLSYYMDTRGVGQLYYQAAEAAVIFGEGVLEPSWDPRAGAPLKKLNPQFPNRKKTGDLVFRVFTPLDLVSDRFRYDQEHDWRITRRFVNRWDVAARYPTLRAKILDLKSDPFPSIDQPTNSIDSERSKPAKNIHRGNIPLYTLYHRRTDALEQGRWCEFLSADILLAEGDLPYDDVPLVPICPGQILRSIWGESLMHHILAAQEVRDNVISAVASNNIAFGTQIIMMPDDAEYSYKELTEGLAVLHYASQGGKVKPEGLNLTAANKEAIEFIRLMREEMEAIWGISATVRGQPGNNINSGAYAALVAQQALEYAGAFQFSFQRAVAKGGNVIVSILKRYADEPIVAEISGKAHGYQVKEFSKASFSNIKSVTVKSGNPATRTPQVAIAMADSLLQRGLIKNVKEYITLVRTGDSDAMLDEEETQLLNIRRENEWLREGKSVRVLATDMHVEHINRHRPVMDDPSIREQVTPEQQRVAAATLEHIMEHINALRETDPILLSLLGQKPLGPLPGAGPAPTQMDGTPPAPEGPPGVPGEQPGPTPVPPPPNTPQGLPTPSGMPTNPLTGAEATPQDGALRA